MAVTKGHPKGLGKAETKDRDLVRLSESSVVTTTRNSYEMVEAEMLSRLNNLISIRREKQSPIS